MPASAVATFLALSLAFAPAPVASDEPAAPNDRAIQPEVPSDVAWPAERESVPPADSDAVAPTDEDDDVDDETALAEDDDADVPGYDPVRDSPEGMQAQRRITGGIALTVVGTVLTLGAIGMGVSDPCRPLAGNSCQRGARNRAAWVMGAPGVAMLAGGITLLTLGLMKRQRILAGVTASRTSGGVVLSGRF